MHNISVLENEWRTNNFQGRSQNGQGDCFSHFSYRLGERLRSSVAPGSQESVRAISIDFSNGQHTYLSVC